MSRIEDLIQAEGLEEVASIGGGGWDWAQMDVWYSKDKRQFFWLSGSGCSCSYFGMDVRSLDDLENGSKEDSLNALKRFIDSENRYSQYIHPDYYLRAKEAIKEMKVEK